GLVDRSVRRPPPPIGAPREAGPVWHPGASLDRGADGRPIPGPAGASPLRRARGALDALAAPARDGIVRPRPRGGGPRPWLAVCARRVATRCRRARRLAPSPGRDDWPRRP